MKGLPSQTKTNKSNSHHSFLFSDFCVSIAPKNPGFAITLYFTTALLLQCFADMAAFTMPYKRKVLAECKSVLSSGGPTMYLVIALILLLLWGGGFLMFHVAGGL